jgi:hypothetical protein
VPHGFVPLHTVQALLTHRSVRQLLAAAAVQVAVAALRQTPAPSHALVMLDGQVSSACPKATLVQVPTLPVTLHAWQLPLHAVLQHTPSTQLPLRQSPFAAHVSPFVNTQAPALLHALGVTHALAGNVSCWPVGTLVQVPRLPATLHAWHAVVHVLLQQTPSTQLPLRHWPSLEQVCPLVSTHALAPLPPLQALGATHALVGKLSVCPEGRLVQVPTLPVTLHAWQMPLQALSQQTPSTQLPLAH